jgi:hypothetical protein
VARDRARGAQRWLNDIAGHSDWPSRHW